MTDDERRFFEGLLAGEGAEWQRFASILEPNLHRSIRRVVADEEVVKDLTSQILVNIVAALGKAATAPVAPQLPGKS